VNQSGIEYWGLCVRTQPASRMTDRQSVCPDVEPRRHFNLNINCTCCHSSYCFIYYRLKQLQFYILSYTAWRRIHL